MKKITYFVIALLSFGLLLAACSSSVPNATGGDGTQATTAPAPSNTTASLPATNGSIPTTAPVPTTNGSVPTTAPVPTTTVSLPTTAATAPSKDPHVAAELEAFDELFRNTSSERNPFFWATGHEYTSPNKLQIIAYFDGGFEGEHELTDAEREELSQLIVGPGKEDVNRLPKDKMNAELQAVFGISLADLSDSAYEGLFYLESTDCYYFFQGGMTSMPKMGSFLDIKHNDDGTVSLTYENGVGDYMITLKPNSNSYLILSNVKVK